MRDLLSIFSYIQRFTTDNLYASEIVFIFLLLHKNHLLCEELLLSKNKNIPDSFYLYIRNLGIECESIPQKLNWKKIIRTLLDKKYSSLDIAKFIETIICKKTILKLYSYATPLEISKLACGILNIQRYDSVYNPACGIGTWLLFVEVNNCVVYGDDINPILINISKILSNILGLKCNFNVSDIFLCDKKEIIYDKVFCHPPLLKSVSIPKDNTNLSVFGSYVKTMPELPFLAYCLKLFSKKAVFIIRKDVLSHAKFVRYIVDNSLLETIIYLPKNLFPGQNEEFCIVVLSNNNKKVHFIDIREFSIKHGKYNVLINAQEILDLYYSKQDSKYSKMVIYDDIKDDLKINICNVDNIGDTVCLSSYINVCFRGQRIENKNGNNLVSCYEIGINDFNEYGFSSTCSNVVLKDNRSAKYFLKKYDICLSMRGNSPKIAIIGDSDKPILANSGIIVMRANCVEIATSLYLYFLSDDGFSLLQRFYIDNNSKINDRIILNLRVPKNLTDNSIDKFNIICDEYKNVVKHRNNIKNILNPKL